MKNYLILTILATAYASPSHHQKYMKYLSQQGKSYSSIDEFKTRLENFIAIDKLIEEWNA
jgi:hypothetical protein